MIIAFTQLESDLAVGRRSWYRLFVQIFTDEAALKSFAQSKTYLGNIVYTEVSVGIGLPATSRENREKEGWKELPSALL